MRDLPDRPPGGASGRLVRAARAAQELCDVLWEALHEELGSPDEARVKALSERLAEVSSTIAMLAGASPSPSSPPSSTPHAPSGERRVPPQPVAPDPTAPAQAPAQSHSEPLPPPVALQPHRSSQADPQPTRIVDEQERPSGGERATHVEPPAAAGQSPSEIEIHDTRREEGPSAWVSSVGRLLARHAEDGLPFAVLLVEIVDVAHLERSETPHDLHGLVAKVEDGIGRAMRAADHLSRETLGRYWLVAPETNGTGARMLAERLARLVRTSASHRGVPMEVAIGIAVCPEDGTEAPALAARADLGVYSARATGRSIAHTDPPQAS